VRRRLYRTLYRRVDLVTVFSEQQRPLLIDTLGLRPEQVITVPFGVDLDELAALAGSGHAEGRAASAPDAVEPGYLLAAGRDLGRDWDTLFAAADTTGRRVVVLSRLRHLPSRPPPEIEVLGYVERERYLQLLAGADGVLLITRDPAYPTGQTVLLEALALAKPCVVTATPAMTSFAGDLPCTWVPMGDVEAVRAAIAGVSGSRQTLRPSVPDERLDARAMWSAVDAAVRARGWGER
jgi:glycosyltransferase involved in cell wall biosynthesis